jgi:diguanylate cyclase (GGDEF)-like protein/PAS domain S-box-containing protein
MTTGSPRERALRVGLSPELLLGGAYFLMAVLCILATRLDGGVALIWPGNAVAAAVLIRLRTVNWLRAALALACAGVLANRFAAQDSWGFAVALTLVNLAEIAVMVYAYRVVFRFPAPNITIAQASHMTVGLGVVITGVGALAGGTLVHTWLDAPLLPAIEHWWAATALGACLFAPPVMLFSRAAMARLIGRRHRALNLVTLLTCVVGTYLAIRHVRFPFVVVSLLPMMAAFQVGGMGASILGLCCGMTVVVLWLVGIYPSGLTPGVIDPSLIGMPLVAMIVAVMPPMAVGLGTDARRKVARALQASERRFRESMEHSPVGMILLDLRGRWTFTNAAMQTMLGRTHAELVGLSMDELTHPADIEEMHARWDKLMDQEVDSYTVTRRLRHGDGSWVWVHGAVAMARNEDGTPLHFISHVESLQERRQAEAQLAAERELLRATLAAIGEAVITADATGRVTYMNDAACALLGVPLAAVQGQRLQDVLRLENLDGTRAPESLVARCITERAVFRQEEPCALLRADGVSYVSQTISPVLDSDGALTGIILVLQDASAAVARTRDLLQLAHHDPLTGLMNRAGFEQHARQVFSRARLSGAPAALIALDLDRFKSVNDAGGHAAGDAVLRRVAEVLRSLVRPEDTVARLGGDEFVLLLNNCPQSLSLEVARRVLRALNPLATDWNAATFQTGASLGLALATDEFASAGQWAEAADQASYVAKRQGRGTLQVHRGNGRLWETTIVHAVLRAGDGVAPSRD